PGVLPVDFIPLLSGPDYRLGIRQSGTGFMVVLRIKIGPSGNVGTWFELTTVTAGSLAALQWYHIAWTYDGSVVSLYVNGVVQATLSQPGQINDAAGSLTIGNQPGFPAVFAGDIDELRVSNVIRPIVPSTTPFVPDANTLGLW